jgi:hypothetical protein
MKSEFRTTLEVEQIPGNLWRLLAPFVYYSENLGREITVPAGFITDFASVPRLPVAYLLAGGEANEAAVIHDYLYKTHIVDRETSDAILDEAMAASGQPWWRRKLMWAGVRLFGGTPYADDLADNSKG